MAHPLFSASTARFWARDALTRLQIKPRAVARASHNAALQLAFGQVAAAVGAPAADGVVITITTSHQYILVLYIKGFHPAGGYLIGTGNIDELHFTPPFSQS
jgi:hypothetical protein